MSVIKIYFSEILFLFLFFVINEEAFSQNESNINGIVVDETGEPLVGANVFILGTINGCITDNNGRFNFTSNQKNVITLIIKYIGYKDYTFKDSITKMRNLKVILHEEEVSIDDIIVVASSFTFGKGGDKLKTMDSYDVVSTGSSNGDIYAALQSLPGTQKVGENGRLYIRGGESDETQTFVNGMHVLVPYTTNAENSVQRSRFSPFLFKGINFTLGGYSGEYGQALSSVLPMETTDVSSTDKFGISISPFDLNIGGTTASKKSSFSFNTDYMNMYLYNKMVPDIYDWKSPYQKISGEMQYKVEFTPQSVLKNYIGYDYTTFSQNINDAFDGLFLRELSLKEHNIYLNSTYKSNNSSNDFSFFMGVANSFVYNTTNDLVLANDKYNNLRNELHVKSFINKSYSSIYKFTLGAEGYFRHSTKEYDFDNSNSYDYHLNYNIGAAFLDNQIKICKGVYWNFSGRLEYSDYNKRLDFMPRTSLSFIPIKNIQLTAMYGIYSQVTDDDILAKDNALTYQGMAEHKIISFTYTNQGNIIRIEPYYKKYRHLPLLKNNIYTSDGKGTSKGIDFYFENYNLIHNLRTTLSYSYNDTKRLYKNYPVLSQPQYVTNHNLCFSLRYNIESLKTYIGASNSFASGRYYTNPNILGFLNSKTPYYNSLDINLTFLLKPNIILYTSLTNVLGRKNIFNYNYSDKPNTNQIYSRVPVVSSRESFFYIGLYISLKNSKAYDISNF